MLCPSPSAPSTTFPSESATEEDNCTVNCSSGFYCTANNTCNPQCGSWEQHSHDVVVAVDTAVILSACIGVVAGITVFVVAGVRRKHT